MSTVPPSKWTGDLSCSRSITAALNTLRPFSCRGSRPGWRTRASYSPPGRDAAYDQTTMLRMARELLAANPGDLLAVGVSFGGPVDAQRGLVRLSYHVPGWDERPLREMLQAEFGVPAAVDNDGNVAALRRVALGRGPGTATACFT